jgi:DNA helicase-2/ATP-dependent DNA helicase PcrA
MTGNPAQLRAIEHGEGAACVIAGPGSGKTFVIIKRVIRLIEKGVSPGNILVITFTKAAAIEMQQRFTKETNSMYPEVLFGTFHSCFYQILQQSGSRTNNTVTIMREADKYNCLGHILKDLQAREKINHKSVDYDKETIKLLLSVISRVKNDGAEPEQASMDVPLREYFPNIFKEYRSLMKEQSLIDFDDMVLMCHDLLSSNRDVLKLWQDKFKYILIDEYQDINRMQFEVVKLLAGKRENLFVVGDDDQSIYGFRGSRPEFMLDFKKHFYMPKEILLDVNYRCSKEILEGSLKVIEENNIRFKKDIKAGSQNRGNITGLTFEDKDSEYGYIADKLKNLSLKNTAIIFRTNTEATAMAKFLINRDIPCSYRERITLFHEKNGVSDVISYLRFSNNGFKRSDFLKIMNKPVRYISRESLTDDTVELSKLAAYFVQRGRMSTADSVKKLERDVRMIRSLRPYLAIHYIRNVLGFNKYLKDKYLSDKARLDEIMKDLDDLMEQCRRFEEYSEFEEYLKEQEKIKEISKNTDFVNKEGVKIMTMHASKGLEFDNVFIPDLNEGIIPSRRSISAADVEEERRMFYVAMTRAKKELCLSYVRGTKENPSIRSGFLRPLSEYFCTAR